MNFLQVRCIVNPTNFGKSSPGRVVKSVLGHWTFQPERIPPNINFSSELVQCISLADLALGELAGTGRRLRNPQLLMRPFIRREAVLSSQIEGTITRLDQLFLFEAEPDSLSHPSDAGEVQNYVHAMEYGLNVVRSGYPFSLQMIREMHRILLEGVRGADKRPGEIRDRAVLIGNTFDFDQARFVPPCHTTLTPLLQDFVDFLRNNRSLPIVAQLALMHYQFETIHPFNDGNGRVGRLLITLMLCERLILPQPLLYLSAFFEQHRQEYYDGLLGVSQRGEWNQWIQFFARGISEQARDAVIRVQRLEDLRDSYKERFAKIRHSLLGLKLIDHLFEMPYITVKQAGKVLDVVYKSADKIVKCLIEAEILQEITNQKRYRIYCAHEVLRLLDQPLEP